MGDGRGKSCEGGRKAEGFVEDHFVLVCCKGVVVLLFKEGQGLINRLKLWLAK